MRDKLSEKDKKVILTKLIIVKNILNQVNVGFENISKSLLSKIKRGKKVDRKWIILE